MKIEIKGKIRENQSNVLFNMNEFDRMRLADNLADSIRDLAYKNIEEEQNNECKITLYVYNEQEHNQLLDKKSNDKIKSLELVREIFIENTNKTWEEEIKAKDTIFLGKRKKELDLINFLDKVIEKLKITK